MKQDNRLIALDVGRALAILGVIAAHLSAWVPGIPSWLSLLATSGQYGVQLFFVISAITICKTLSDEKRKGFDTRTLVRRFYLKRFLRIAPLYYVGIVVYGVLDQVAFKIFHAHALAPHTTWDVLANALFVHEFIPTAINSVVPGGWSIGVEMAFYLFAPALIFMPRMRGRLWLTTTIMFCTSYGVLWIAKCHTGTNAIANSTFLYYWPPTQFPCFALGIFVWIHCKSRLLHEHTNIKLALLTPFWIVIGYAAALAAGVGMNLSHAIAPVIAAGVGALILIFLASSPYLIKSFTIAQKLGEKSYGVYIWHFIGIFIVRIILKILNMKPTEISSILIFLLGMVFVSILAYSLSYITEYLIEKPISKWLKKILLKDATHPRFDANKLTTASAGE